MQLVSREKEEELKQEQGGLSWRRSKKAKRLSCKRWRRRISVQQFIIRDGMGLK